MKILNIKHVFKHKFGNAKPTHERMQTAYAAARKRGVNFGNDGRAYIPESKRGRGVGYGRKGKAS